MIISSKRCEKLISRNKIQTRKTENINFEINSDSKEQKKVEKEGKKICRIIPGRMNEYAMIVLMMTMMKK